MDRDSKKNFNFSRPMRRLYSLMNLPFTTVQACSMVGQNATLARKYPVMKVFDFRGRQATPNADTRRVLHVLAPRQIPSLMTKKLQGATSALEAKTLSCKSPQFSSVLVRERAHDAQDETRIGRKTETKRVVTAPGMKPLAQVE